MISSCRAWKGLFSSPFFWELFLVAACMACLQAMLEQLERPLLCSSIRAEDQLSGALPDGALLLDEFGSRGLDFVVDNGRRVRLYNSVS